MHFIRIVKNIQSIPTNAILVPVDVVGLYLSLPHGCGLIVLNNISDKRKKLNIPTADLVETIGFLNNSYFDFTGIHCIRG